MVLLLMNIQIGEIFNEDKFTHISRNLFMTMAANGKVGDSLKVIEAYEGTVRSLFSFQRTSILVTLSKRVTIMDETQLTYNSFSFYLFLLYRVNAGC